MRSFLRMILSLLAMLLLVPACGDNTTSSETGRVTGTVTEVYSGSPLRDIGIFLVATDSITPGAALTQTDTTGAYLFQDVASGRYAIFVYSDSLVVHHRPSPFVDVTKGRTVTYDLTLQAAELWNGEGQRIRGIVVDDDTENPIPGAFVAPSLWGSLGQDLQYLLMGINVPDWGVTDTEGRFSVTCLTFSGTTTLPISVTREGYMPYTLVGEGEADPILGGAPIPLPLDGSDLVVTVRLKPVELARTGSLRGRVVYRGAPVAGLKVGLSLIASADPDTLRKVGGPEPAPVQGKVAISDAQGSFLFEGLGAGTYGLAPAFPEGDGYVPALSRVIPGLEQEPVMVTVGDTTDAGDVPVVKAILPISPVPGSIVATTTPQFEWTAVAAATLYDLKYGDTYLAIDGPSSVEGVTWQVPDSSALRVGSHVRWMVYAYDADGVLVGGFERPVTFSVTDHTNSSAVCDVAPSMLDFGPMPSPKIQTGQLEVVVTRDLVVRNDGDGAFQGVVAFQIDPSAGAPELRLPQCFEGNRVTVAPHDSLTLHVSAVVINETSEGSFTGEIRIGDLCAPVTFQGRVYLVD